MVVEGEEELKSLSVKDYHMQSTETKSNMVFFTTREFRRWRTVRDEVREAGRG